jgi:hypothetical protein
MRRNPYSWSLLVGFLFGGLAILPVAGHCAQNGSSATCAECGATCPACDVAECTVLVPMEVVELRMQTCVRYENQERQETYTVFERVPEKRSYNRDCWYLDDEVQRQTIEEKKCQVVMNPVVRTYKVQVPMTEMREGMVRQEICTPTGKECVEVPCKREVTYLREEERTCTREEPDVVFLTTKREIDYCIKVPKKETKVCAEETVYQLVPVQKTRTVQACVPKLVKEPVEVTVCKMVPKTISCCTGCASRHR